MWVEILRPDEAAAIPITELRPPSPEEWELRVVIWHAFEVPLQDSIDIKVCFALGTQNKNFFFFSFVGLVSFSVSPPWQLCPPQVSGEPDGYGEQETDTHMFVKDGTGNFNYRF